MFGFRGGETQDVVARKEGYMEDAKARWSFLTTFDLSTIKNDVQLSTIVKDRSGATQVQAREDVHAWMADKQF